MKTCLLILALLWRTTASGATNLIFSPSNPQNLYTTASPFVIQAPSVRYQQVYASSEFSLVPGPHLITELSFTSSDIDITLPNVQINLSTTQKQPDGLSTTFSQNVGVDSAIVYSGQLPIRGSSLDNFTFHIPLDRSFLYNPDAGNLLLEIRNFQPIAPSTVPWFLATSTVGDGSSIATALNATSDTAILGTGALLTEFKMVDVPEPSTLTLLAILGFAALAAPRLLRRRPG